MIRPALIEDTPYVLGVLLPAYRTWSEYVEYVPSLRDPIHDIQHGIQSAKTLVVEMDNAIVGYARFEICDGIGSVSRLAIHPIHQRRGLGGCLLQETEKAIRALEGYAVEFRVPAVLLAPSQFLKYYKYQRFQIGASLNLFRKEMSTPTLRQSESFKRVGACRRTGKCCSRIFLRWNEGFLSREDAERLGEGRIRELNEFTSIVGVHLHGELKDGTAFFQCNQLYYDNEGMAACRLYKHPDRPPVCSMFPVAPSAYRYRDCGFNFTSEEPHVGSVTSDDSIKAAKYLRKVNSVTGNRQ